MDPIALSFLVQTIREKEREGSRRRELRER